MQKLKKLGAMLLLGTVIYACSDDDAPAKRLRAGDFSINLSGSNLYLVNESEFNGNNDTWLYRDYAISDGEFDEGSGWSLSDYIGASYYFMIELAVPTSEEYGPGEFITGYNWSDTPEGQRMTYFYAEDDDTFYLENPSDENGDKVIVSGGMDDGETMQVSFNGTVYLSLYNPDTDEYEGSEVTGSFFFSGQVQSVLGSIVPVESPQLRRRSLK